MDEFERASKLEMDHRELSVAHQRAQNQPLKFTGFCLSCNERLEIGRFCFGGECKEDYEREQRIAKIMGR
jgi:hypothetical protein